MTENDTQDPAPASESIGIGGQRHSCTHSHTHMQSPIHIPSIHTHTLHVCMWETHKEEENIEII